VSYDNYNLACIVTFPPYQKKGYGTLMIEFSKFTVRFGCQKKTVQLIFLSLSGYQLSRHENPYGSVAGTPERPLSDLGLRGYVAYWTSVIVRYLRRAFEIQGVPEEEADEKEEGNDEDGGGGRKARGSLKGWEGEIIRSEQQQQRRRSSPRVASSVPPAENGRARGGGDGGKRSLPPFSLELTVTEIARAVGLRPDDVSLALVHSGLARYRRRTTRPRTSSSVETVTGTTTTVPHQEQQQESTGDAASFASSVSNGAEKTTASATTTQSSAGADDEVVIVVTPEWLEEVTTSRRVKPPIMDPAYCLL
jgi:hypothetical protein